MKKKRNQYHPVFCVSMENCFVEDKQYLDFMTEVELNTKPNRIDMLIVKSSNIVLKSSLGAIFKEYNIIEYKSPKAALNIGTYTLTMAYMYQHHAYRVGNTFPEHDRYSIT